MAGNHAIDFAALLPKVAREFWGDPSSETTREIRWGKKGGKMVVPSKGVWQDHALEAGDINKGGTLDLIARETGLRGQEAIEWLVNKGFITEDKAKEGRTSRAGVSPGKPLQKRMPEDDIPPPDDETIAANGNGHAAHQSNGLVSSYDPDLEATFGIAPERKTQPEGPAISTPRALVASYDYTDPQGSLLYQVQRWEWLDKGKKRKMFVQRRPYDAEPNVWIIGLNAGDYMRANDGDNWTRYDEEKAHKYGLNQRTTFGGTGHALYRIEELRDAITAGETVFLPEGEKKVEALRELGLPASCNSGGASNWNPDFAQYFRDADVVIPVDCDKPGRKRGDDIAKTLYGVAKRVRIFDLQHFASDQLPEKYDVADWIKAGNDAERLFDFCQRIEAWEPPKFKSKFGAVTWSEMDQAGPEHQWLVDELLTWGERSLMAGPSGSGKTFFAMHTAMSVSRGIEFFGRPVRQCGVIYQAGEGGKGVKKRIRAYRKEHGLTPEDKMPFVLLTSPIDLFANEDNTNELIAECRHWATTFDGLPLGLIVIDTWSAATPGADENSSRDVGPVLARCERISAATGAHVMLVHHMNASGERVRGHTSIAANIDSVITVKKQEARRDASEHHRLLREATVAKLKDGEEGSRFEFVLKAVSLESDASGKPVTSCVVIPPDLGAMSNVDTTEEVGFTLTPQGKVLLQAIYTAIDRQGMMPPPDLRLPSYCLVVEWKYIVEEFERTWFDESGESGDQAKRKASMDKALARQGTVLLGNKVISRSNPWVWLTGKKVRGFVIPKSAERQPRPKPAAPPEPAPSRLTSDDVFDFIGDGMED